MATSFKSRISEVLVTQRVLTRRQLDQVIGEASRNGRNFVRLLIERGVISESKLTELLSRELGLPVVSLAKYRIKPEVARLIPERVARQYNLIALSKLGERLTVAMADPLDVVAMDNLKALTRAAIDPVLCQESEIRRAIEQTYASEGAMPVLVMDGAGEEEADPLGTAVAVLLKEDTQEEATVVQVINLMVVEAMRRRASDIHLEPGLNDLRVRYRIDGHLVEVHRLPKGVQNTVLTRLKIMSGLDITESRLPQDGRFKVRMENREVDFRVSVLPITQGGKVVLRLLDQQNLAIGLDQLGFLPQDVERFEAAIKRAYGMILITGPTGSGKSTTLYSLLSKLNAPTRNLITLEDPVEYQVEGLTQIQMNQDIGLTFANGLRAVLRHNPDVVMIGEIRDFETADIAMKSSLTGHLVFSTLHTNDAPSAVTRLIDMGVEPFLVASSVTIVEAQRLVRKLCTKCREPFEPPQELLQASGCVPAKGAAFFRAKGCRLCNETGYKGRMSIVELFEVDERVRELIVSRAQSWAIKDYAVKNKGMVILREDGLRKAAMGVTTLEEVLGVTNVE